MNKSIYIGLLMLLLTPALLLADTIYLKNGRRVDGKIVGQTREVIRINVNGRQQRINKTDVRRVVYGPVPTRQPNNQRELEAEKKRLAEERERLAEEREKLERERDALESERGKPTKTFVVKSKSELSDWELTRNAFLRSAVLPGWGQYYQERQTPGTIYGASFLVALAGTVVYERRYDRDRDAYNRASTGFLLSSPAFASFSGATVSDVTPYLLPGILAAENASSARSRVDTSARRSNFFRGALVGIYAWNLIDVVLFRPEAGTVGLGMRRGDLSLSYNLTF